MTNALRQLTVYLPKFALSNADIQLYKRGLLTMSLFTHDHFLDIPPLPKNRYYQDGLFYNMPYLQHDYDHRFSHIDNKRTLLVVCKVTDGVLSCPYRFALDYTDETHFHIFLCDQSGYHVNNHLFIERDGSHYYSELQDIHAFTLSAIEEPLALL